jgi:predicted class III extradiol MEMO1 family dioxygenase
MASFSKKFSIPGKDSDAIYQAVSSDIERFLSKTPLGTVEVSREAGSKKVTFKSSMASGTLTASEGALSVDVSLSFLASAFKGKIEEGVTRWLNKTFNV